MADQTVRYCVVVPDGRKSKPQTFEDLKFAFESGRIPNGAQIETAGDPESERRSPSDFFLQPEDGSEYEPANTKISPVEKRVTLPLELPISLTIAGVLGVVLICSVPLGMVIALNDIRQATMFLAVVSGFGLACFGMFLLAFAGFAEKSLQLLQRTLESIDRQQ
ncbi:MAG: hypothetical protein MK102_09850 [Fuerstiella sp.]|nr:hypothetical protein [Fuerstiella sp.]